MTFLDIQNQIVTISNVTQQTDLIKKSVNIALMRIAEYFEWPFYMVANGVINTTAPYSTGTCTVTNGSASIVGTGTLWTSAMVGRKFRFFNDQAYYRIKTVNSSTSITLSTPYQGSTNSSGSTYIVYKDEYRLAPDVDTYKTIVQIENQIAMASTPPATFDRFFPSPYSYSHPTIEIMEGTKLDTYSSGTVSVTANSSTITGASTSWTSVEGLGRYSLITIGTNVYTVKSLDSDTSITIFEVPNTTVSSQTYSISLNNLMVQVFPIPSQQENLYYRYFRIPSPLINSYDVPDLPVQWQYLLIYGSLSFVFLSKGDINKSQIESEARFLEGLQHMKKKLGSYASDRKWRVQSQDNYVTIGDGLEKSTFDRKYSSP
jgi:hypothetical protein